MLNSQEALDHRSSGLATFCVIPSDILVRTDLSPLGKILLAALNGSSNEFGFSEITDYQLSVMFMLEEEQVKSGLEELDGRFMTTEMTDNGRRLWIVNEEVRQVMLERMKGGKK